jgi:hypothetical protein
MENKIYYIYHIPTFLHKDGRIGKIGCTEEEDAKVRVEKQGYTEYEILETHTDIMIASDREMELQKEYGYPVDKVPYYLTRQIPTEEGCKKGGKSAIKIRKNNKEKWKNSLLNFQIAGGKTNGPKLAQRNVESGWISNLGKKMSEINNRLQTCPYCGIEAKGIGFHRWHGENCKHKPTAI